MDRFMRLFYPAFRNSQDYFGMRAVMAKYKAFSAGLERDSTNFLMGPICATGQLWRAGTRKRARLPAMVIPVILFLVEKRIIDDAIETLGSF